MLGTARHRRQRGAMFAGAAGVLLLFAVALQMRAELSEGIGDIASYLMGASALLALIGAWLALRSAGNVRAHGVDAPIVMLALVVVLGVFGAFLGLYTPAIYNAVNDVCMAEGGSKMMLGASLVPAPCGFGNVVPDSDFPSFYPGAAAGAVAVAAALASIWLLVRAHVPREQPG